MKNPDLLGLYLKNNIRETIVKRSIKCTLFNHSWSRVIEKYYDPFNIISSSYGDASHYQCKRCNKLRKCSKCNSLNLDQSYGWTCGTCDHRWGNW